MPKAVAIVVTGVLLVVANLSPAEAMWTVYQDKNCFYIYEENVLVRVHKNFGTFYYDYTMATDSGVHTCKMGDRSYLEEFIKLGSKEQREVISFWEYRLCGKEYKRVLNKLAQEARAKNKEPIPVILLENMDKNLNSWHPTQRILRGEDPNPPLELSKEWDKMMEEVFGRDRYHALNERAKRLLGPKDK